MILTVDQAKLRVDFKDWTDERIAAKLAAIEQTIRKYTNNNFQDRGYRKTADIVGGLFLFEPAALFDIGDTVQITETELNEGLYTVATVDDAAFTVNEPVRDEQGVLVTKIVYPADVIDCAVNMLTWDIQRRDKVGIQSETLSRHSVTYFNMGASDQLMGYPAAILGVLRAYKKARF